VKSDIIKTGVFVALGILIWQGQVVFFTIWGVYLAFVILLNYKDSDLIKKIAVSFLFAALIGSTIAAIVRFIIPRSTEQTLFDFGFLSYFQPIYVAFIYAVVYLLAYFVEIAQKNRANIIKFATGLVVKDKMGKMGTGQLSFFYASFTKNHIGVSFKQNVFSGS
jgi:hypothetical protein